MSSRQSNASHSNTAQSPRRNYLLLLVACLSCIPLLEGTVRIRAHQTYGTWSYLADDGYTTDTKTGHRRLRTDYAVGGAKINSLGFRGPEVPTSKPLGTIRLAYLGGSTTFCQECGPEERTWPYLVWVAAQRAFPTLKFDYINGGVPGFRTFHSLESLRQDIAPLHPDVIVIYHGINDLADVTRKIARASGIATVSLDRPGALSRVSMLWYLIEKNYRLWSNRRLALTGDPRFTTPATEYVKVFSDNLSALIRESKQHARIVAVVTFAYRLRRDQSPEERLAASDSSRIYMPYLGIPQLLDGQEAFNEEIRKVSAAEGVVLIENNSIPGDREHFIDTVHLTSAGCASMADNVADQLLASPALKALTAEYLDAAIVRPD